MNKRAMQTGRNRKTNGSIGDNGVMCRKRKQIRSSINC